MQNNIFLAFQLKNTLLGCETASLPLDLSLGKEKISYFLTRFMLHK